MRTSFHSGGVTLASLGCLNFTTCNKYVCTNTTGTLSLNKNWNGFLKSGQIVSGLDIHFSNLFLSGTCTTVVTDGSTNNTSLLADCYAHYDSV